MAVVAWFWPWVAQHPALVKTGASLLNAHIGGPSASFLVSLFTLIAPFYCSAGPSFSAGPSGTEVYSDTVLGAYLTLLLAVSLRHFKFNSLT